MCGFERGCVTVDARGLFPADIASGRWESSRRGESKFIRFRSALQRFGPSGMFANVFSVLREQLEMERNEYRRQADFPCAAILL